MFVTPSQASDAYYSSLETSQHLDGLLGLGTTASYTHSQADALVALQQHLDLNPGSAQVRELSGEGLTMFHICEQENNVHS